MHEWALAEAVVKTAGEIAKKEGLKQVTEVTVKIGELQDVEREIFRFALSQIKPASFEDAKFRISTAKTLLKCKVCGNTWKFSDNKIDKETAEAIHFVPEVAHTYIKCPHCGSPDFEILQGRGVWLQSIKGAK
ncbi:MAG: hydrogenase nickel incorporation protein HypA [Candidatus Bathyarchaeota archaeon]|nr:hydrogenase nickel incorporation protein HypA [Candidatus Bathyarchaeota archaeon]